MGLKPHTSQATSQRTISDPPMVFFELGTIIGPGIYVLVGQGSGQVDFWMSLVFLLAVVVAGLTSLSYAETRLSCTPRARGSPATAVGLRTHHVVPLGRPRRCICLLNVFSHIDPKIEWLLS
jgi:hypothetical protein